MQGLSHLQAMELAHRQGVLEEVRSDVPSSGPWHDWLTVWQGLHRLISITESLSTQYDGHSQLLNQAQNVTNEILGSLESVAAVHGSGVLRQGSSGWWPHVICPTVSLVMGSYGLPPSVIRNLGLLALGQAIGYAVSSYHRFSAELLGFWGPVVVANLTAPAV